jgi:hypothetical protein
VLSRAAVLLRAHVDDFANWRRSRWASASTRRAARSSSARTSSPTTPERRALPRAGEAESRQVGEAHMESSPFGVLFCVEPWNFPYYQLARVAGPQLMAGNVLVVKHAGMRAAMRDRLREAAARRRRARRRVHQPADLARAVRPGHRRPAHQGRGLTGSVAAGRSIAARAGKNLKKTSMELGGSDAFIVLDDADLERTDPVGGLGPHVQRRPDLLRGQALHRASKASPTSSSRSSRRRCRAEGRRSDGREDHARSRCPRKPRCCNCSSRSTRRRQRRQAGDGRQAHRSSRARSWSRRS